mmetsp:Transcript_28945/g.75018  ORF Transcript_28945/g.75018 Transcript_28945/m.75018 type:complete len:224 (-) Transcript_28945:319-990(-)
MVPQPPPVLAAAGRVASAAVHSRGHQRAKAEQEAGPALAMARQHVGAPPPVGYHTYYGRARGGDVPGKGGNGLQSSGHDHEVHGRHHSFSLLVSSGDGKPAAHAGDGRVLLPGAGHSRLPRSGRHRRGGVVLGGRPVVSGPLRGGAAHGADVCGVPADLRCTLQEAQRTAVRVSGTEWSAHPILPLRAMTQLCQRISAHRRGARQGRRGCVVLNLDRPRHCET